MAKTNYARYSTNKSLQNIESKISAVFGEAAADIEKQMDEYVEKGEAYQETLASKIAAGTITGEQADSLMDSYWSNMGRLNELSRKVESYVNYANDVATAYVKDKTPEIYSLNYNYSAYSIEGLTNYSVDFNLWDEATVRRLIVKEPDLLPTYPSAKSKKINMSYTQKQVRAAVTSGILQGKSIDKIAKDIQSRITTISKNSAIRAARTAVTSAQNAGRIDAMYAAKSMGIEVEKEWVATLDSVTRPTHAALDGTHIPLDERFSNGCDHPGDSTGPAAEVYNCRCTIVAWLPQADTKNAWRWSKDSSGNRDYVSGVTYSQWAASKTSSGKTVSNMGVLANATTFAKTQGLSDEFKAGLANALSKCENEVVKNVYETYADKIRCVNNSYTEGAHYQTGLGVRFDEKTIVGGTSYQEAYQTAFHEFGHNIDNLIGEDISGDWKTYASELWYSGEGESGTWYNTTLGRMIQSDYEEFAKKIKKKFKVDTTDNQNVIDYLAADEFSTKAVGNISDALEGCTDIDFPLGIGHGTSYHSSIDRTACEFFAETLDATVANEESLYQMKRVFPNAVQMVYDIIGGIS